MPSIPFTENYEDLSTDRGAQFKFYCEKCNNGYMSTFISSKTGMLGTAANLAGGLFGVVAGSTDEGQPAAGGRAKGTALEAAVSEISRIFKQCPRCGNRVCEPICWNRKAGLCERCAPDPERRSPVRSAARGTETA